MRSSFHPNDLSLSNDEFLMISSQNQGSQSPSSPRKLSHTMNSFHSQSDHLGRILKKPFHTRTHIENQAVAIFISKNPYMRELKETVSFDLPKLLLKTASFREVKPGKLLSYPGIAVTEMYIVVQGKLGVIKDNPDEQPHSHGMKIPQIYDALTSIARKQLKILGKMKKKNSTNDEFSLIQEHQHPEISGITNLEGLQFIEIIEKNHDFGGYIRCLKNAHTHRCVAIEHSSVIVLNFLQVFTSLMHSFELKLSRSLSLIKQIPCFGNMDETMIEGVIQNMTLMKRRKGEAIYLEGQASSHIYLLEEGSMKIVKSANLFVQNPNELYIDRRKLMDERELRESKYLPYANLTNLFNYRPVKKQVEIGSIAGFCLFGEEEVLENKRRETSVYCTSIEASYYLIDLQKIKDLLADQFAEFLGEIKKSVRAKIMYRQNNFARTMHVQNKANLNYFYYEGEKSKPTPRKYVLSRINKKCVENNLARASNTSNTEALPTQSSQGNPQEFTPMKEKSTIPAYYNTFNFHKMLGTRLQHTEMKNPQQQHSESSSSGKPFSKDINIGCKDLKQKQIMKNSHTWREIKQMVIQQSKQSKRLGSNKHQINFQHPLIDEKYFDRITGAVKKLDRDQRMRKFVVSQPKVIKPGPNNKSMGHSTIH